MEPPAEDAVPAGSTMDEPTQRLEVPDEEGDLDDFLLPPELDWEEDPEEKDLRPGKLIAIAAAVVALVAILIAVFALGGGEKEDTPAESSEPAVEAGMELSLALENISTDRYPTVDVIVSYDGDARPTEEMVSVTDDGVPCELWDFQAGGGKMTFSYRAEDVGGTVVDRELQVMVTVDGDSFRCVGTYTTPSYEPITLEMISTDVSDYPNVKVYFRLKDAHGDPVTGLSKSAFLIRESVDGGQFLEREVKAATVLEGNHGLNISLVADKSGSIYASDMEKIQYVMEEFIHSLDYAVGDKAEILAFDTVVQQMCRFTNETDLLINGISTMRPGGNTALYQALHDGISHAAYQGGARCVLAFTDGLDNEGGYSPQEIIAYSLTNQVPVYIVGVGYEVDENTLRDIAHSTGGYYWHIDNLYDLEQIYSQVYQEQQELYVVEYVSDSDLDQYLTRCLDVVVLGTGCRGTLYVEFVPVRAADLSSHTARYELVKSDMSWEEANRYCEERGGHLVTITSRAEEEEIIAMAEDAGLKHIWLGGYTSGDYDDRAFGHWVTGESFAYENWHNTEPSYTDIDEARTLEKYIMLQDWREHEMYGCWGWNDQRNQPTDAMPKLAEYMGFVCEYG